MPARSNAWESEIYQKISEHVSNEYAIVYVGDESEQDSILHFSQLGIPAEDLIEKGMLTIINRDTFYSPFVPTKMLLNQWDKLFASIRKNALHHTVKGFMAMGMPAESFFLSDVDRQQLVNYETLAAENYDGDWDAMCVYTTNAIERMALRHLVSLLNAHQNTGHSNGILKEWNSKRALTLIKRGLESALGTHVTEMVLAIIVREFENNEDALALRPQDLERKLELLLGETGADLVINHIKKEISNDILF